MSKKKSILPKGSEITILLRNGKIYHGKFLLERDDFICIENGKKKLMVNKRDISEIHWG